MKNTKMLELEVIEPAQTAWELPIALASEHDGTLQVCVDYRKRNAGTVQYSHLILRIEESIDSVRDVTVFSTLDANSGYWQVEIARGDIEISEFASHHEFFQFIRMLFGWKTAPGQFQSVMDVRLSTVH